MAHRFLKQNVKNCKTCKRKRGRDGGKGKELKVRPKGRARKVVHQGTFGIGAAKKARVPALPHYNTCLR